MSTDSGERLVQLYVYDLSQGKNITGGWMVGIFSANRFNTRRNGKRGAVIIIEMLLVS